MADLSFAQPARRNFAVPIALAVAVLAAAAFAVFRLSPRETAETSVTRVAVYPSHLVFKSDSTVVGAQSTQDTLYALVTVRLTDRLRLPLFLKDLTAVLTTADGASAEPVSAVQKGDLAQVFATFPALAKLAAVQGSSPLVRETRVDPKQTVEGWVLLEFPVTAEEWNSRRSAVLHIDLYHQQPLTLDLPKDGTPAGAASRDSGKPAERAR